MDILIFGHVYSWRWLTTCWTGTALFVLKRFTMAYIVVRAEVVNSCQVLSLMWWDHRSIVLRLKSWSKLLTVLSLSGEIIYSEDFMWWRPDYRLFLRKSGLHGICWITSLVQPLRRCRLLLVFVWGTAVGGLFKDLVVVEEFVIFDFHEDLMLLLGAHYGALIVAV
jgi:hypothetical protein